MKTERRQELRTNELGAFLLDINDWAKKYAYPLGGGIVVVALSVLAIRYLQVSRTNSTDAAVITMLGLSFAPEEADASFDALDGIIADAGDPDIKMTALLRKGTSALSLARKTDSDPTVELDRAEQAFQELRQSYPTRMPVVAMALSSLASIEEDRFVVDHDMTHRETARRYLEELQNSPMFKGSPFQTDAAERLQQLDDVFQVITLAPPLPPPPLPPVPDASSAVETPPEVTAPPGIKLRRLDGPPPGFENPDADAASQETEQAAPDAPENAAGDADAAAPPPSPPPSAPESGAGESDAPEGSSENDPPGA